MLPLRECGSQIFCTLLSQPGACYRKVTEGVFIQNGTSRRKANPASTGFFSCNFPVTTQGVLSLLNHINPSFDVLWRSGAQYSL